MNKQPEALRLADALETPTIQAGAFRHEVAAELRRQHAEIESLKREQEEDQCAIRVWRRRADQAEAKSDALLGALRTLLSYAFTLEMRLLDADGEHRAMQRARAAIKMAEED